MNKLLLTLLMLIATAWPSTSFAFEYQGIDYDQDDYTGTCVVSDRNRKITGDIILPEKPICDQVIENGIIIAPGLEYTLVGISEGAFSGSEITSISIPETVTRIGDSAFWGCSSLTSINIPNNSVTQIGKGAFSGCSSLTSIHIPESVTQIGNIAFSGCSSLTSINIPNSVTQIGEGVFSDCSSLISIDILNAVPRIGINAFYSCSSLTSVHLPEGITQIGENAFRYCTSLTSINIPNSVTEIGESAFDSCTSLSSIYIPNGVTQIGEYAFELCSSLKSINIPEAATQISRGAYRGCTSLASITIPESITSIGWEAFEACSSLTSITIPESVTMIGGSAFEECTALSSISIPKNISEIKIRTFAYCTSLKSVDIPYGVTKIGDNVFDSCESLSEIEIPATVSSIGMNTFQDCTGLITISLPEGINVIPYNCFGGCTGLLSISFPKSTSKISSYSLENIKRVANISIAATTVPNSSAVFGAVPLSKDKMSIIAPYDAVDEYLNDYIWKSFKTFKKGVYVSMPDEAVEASALQEEAYQGLLTEAAEKGLDINRMTFARLFNGASLNPCNGTRIFINVKEGEELTAVILDGEDVTDRMEGNSLLIPATASDRLEIICKGYDVGVDTVGADSNADIDLNLPYEVYTLSGQQVHPAIESLNPGIYIIRQNGNVRKISIR